MASSQTPGSLASVAWMKYVLGQQKPHPVKGQITKSPKYQPLMRLADGTWVMGFISDTPGQLGVLIDLNPSVQGHERALGFAVKRFDLNLTNGQVSDERPLGQ